MSRSLTQQAIHAESVRVEHHPEPIMRENKGAAEAATSTAHLRTGSSSLEAVMSIEPPPTDKAQQATHRVTWDGDNATFHCDGSTTSPCHMYPDCECEYWTETCRASHENAPHERCWRLDWLNNIPAEDTWYDGGAVIPSMPKVDGVIETEWDGDCLLWCYADSDELAAAAGGVS